MFYPDNIITDVINANDIEDVISSYITLKRSGRGCVGLCPFHNEKTPSFHVSTDKQLYHCFGCGEGGTVINFIMKAENLDFVDALKLLAQRAGIVLPEPEQSGDAVKQSKKKQRMLSANAFAAKFFYNVLSSMPEGAGGREYVKKRNFSPKTVTNFGLGFAPNSYNALINHMQTVGYTKEELYDFGLAIIRDNKYIDKFRNRVMFPIIDVRGNVIGFGGRVLDGPDVKPKVKYLNSPETDVFSKRINLFALNFAKNSKENNLILVEGFADVITLHQAGVTNVVATLGTSLTEEQARLIKKYAGEVIICYDTDTPGVTATMRAIDIFSKASVRAKVLSLKGAKDPDEFINKNGGADAFLKAAKAAVPATLFKLNTCKAKYDVQNNIDDKVKFLQEAAKILFDTHNPVEIDTYADMLSETYNIKKESVYSEIKRLSGRQRKNDERKVSGNTFTAVKAGGGERKIVVHMTPTEIKEKSLIYLMYSNKGCARKAERELGVDFFENGVLKKLASLIIESWKNDIAPEPKNILSNFDENDSSIVTGILLSDAMYDDPSAAADGLISDIIRLGLDKKIAEEQAKPEPDAAVLMKLLKMRQSGAGTGGGAADE